MSLRTTAALPLLVPAADILAKNLRALEQSKTTTPSTLKPTDTISPTLLIELTSSNDTIAQNKPQARFRRAPEPSRPNPLTALFTFFLSPASKSTSTTSTTASSDNRITGPRGDSVSLPPFIEKLLPSLEKAASLSARVPDPTTIFLTAALIVLLISRLRPHWLHSLLARFFASILFVSILLLSLIWSRTSLFSTLREGRNPFVHPAEHRLDSVKAELSAREARVRTAQETLRGNWAQLDALRKELAKDPNAGIPDAVIIPNRKAAAMIAAGALGAGYDADTAQEVEQRRREESVRRCREEWRVKVETHEGNRQVTNESVKKMADHAATAYTTRTRELKTRSSAAAGRGDKFINLRKVAQKASVVRRKEEIVGLPTRQSERSLVDTVTTTESTKRRSLFRRKRRETTPNLNNRLSLSESGRGGY